MAQRIGTTVVLAIGDIPMIKLPVRIELVERYGKIEINSVHVKALDNRALRIEREGICEADGRYLQSPMSKAIWTAAQTWLDTSAHVALVPA